MTAELYDARMRIKMRIAEPDDYQIRRIEVIREVGDHAFVLGITLLSVPWVCLIGSVGFRVFLEVARWF